jgi:hypothetical protein
VNRKYDLQIPRNSAVFPNGTVPAFRIGNLDDFDFDDVVLGIFPRVPRQLWMRTKGPALGRHGNEFPHCFRALFRILIRHRSHVRPVHVLRVLLLFLPDLEPME